MSDLKFRSIFARVPLAAILSATLEWGTPLTQAVSPAPSREVRATDMTVEFGQTNYVVVEMEAQGNENALGFSLSFDPARLSFVGAVLGSGAGAALIDVNTNQIGSGRVGLAIAMRAGVAFAAGTRALAKVGFSGSAASNSTAMVEFVDQPIGRTIIDTSARPLTAHYVNGTVTIIGPPRYRLTLAVNSIGIGLVEANPLPDADGRYAAGTEVRLTAQPAAGYQFAYWSGNPPAEVNIPEWDRQNPLDYKMTSDKVLMASFTLIEVPPVIINQPQDVSASKGTTLAFSVTAIGTQPLSFQWQKDEANLANGERISGATSSTLTLSNIQVEDAGSYRVVVTNQIGATNSNEAELIVIGSESSAVSTLADRYTPGSFFLVSLVVTPSTDVSSYTVEDQPPSGWTIVSATGDGRTNAAGSQVEWGPFTDGNARILLYVVVPPAGAGGLVHFQGSIKLNGQVEIPITGQRQSADEPLKPPVLWANMYAGLTIIGTVGQTSVIQYVTNLNETNNWINLTSLVLTNPMQLWFDLESPNVPQRFYRAIQAP